jgi:hypothetical protein
MSCSHYEWANTRKDTRQLGLRCVDCDVLWPGHDLPKPPHTVEGYGPVAGLRPWRERVGDMLDELEQVA